MSSVLFKYWQIFYRKNRLPSNGEFGKMLGGGSSTEAHASGGERQPCLTALSSGKSSADPGLAEALNA
jgi:hypothetical protein